MAKKKHKKWQAEYLAEIGAMSNRGVLYEYTSLAGGDDYDGCYTKEGEWKWEKIQEELRRRLDAYGFFGRRTVLTEKRYDR